MFMIPTLAHRPPLSLELSTAADNLIRLIRPRAIGAASAYGMAQLAANLGRNFMEGPLGILTAVFEAAEIDT